MDADAAIAELLVDLNRRPFKKLPGCCLDAFESIDRPGMKPLPATRYEYAEWIKAKVCIQGQRQTQSSGRGVSSAPPVMIIEDHETDRDRQE